MYMICPLNRCGPRSPAGQRHVAFAGEQALAGQVAEIKIMKGISIHDEKRSAEVLSSVFDRAVEMKIDPVAVRKIFEILIAMSEDRQRELTDEGNLP